ncbi:hypothetical protein BD769DRAFT_1388599 [Suillus cothurnatus]|nr:hypothetical protein BD769DRAFT_1388599 [Suillus cothurnatus]
MTNVVPSGPSEICVPVAQSLPTCTNNLLITAAMHSQSGESEMHACFTPPPSSIGQLSPTRQDEDLESSCQLWPDSIQTPAQASDHDSSLPERPHYRCNIPMKLGASSKRFRGRRLSPSSDSDVTSTSSDDELFALPGLPPSKNMSYYVQRAKRQFKPYDRQGHVPNAIELRFFHKSVGKYSSETNMTLADVQAGKELFERGLQGMSNKAVAQAVVAMQATRECKRLRVLTTAWEIESSVQCTRLLETMMEQDALEYARSDAEASSFKKLLVKRTPKELDIDTDFNIGAYNCDIMSFVVSDVQLDHIEGLARNLRLPGEDNDDSMDSEGESSDSKFDISGVVDLFLMRSATNSYMQFDIYRRMREIELTYSNLSLLLAFCFALGLGRWPRSIMVNRPRIMRATELAAMAQCAIDARPNLSERDKELEHISSWLELARIAEEEAGPLSNNLVAHRKIYLEQQDWLWNHADSSLPRKLKYAVDNAIRREFWKTQSKKRRPASPKPGPPTVTIPATVQLPIPSLAPASHIPLSTCSQPQCSTISSVDPQNVPTSVAVTITQISGAANKGGCKEAIGGIEKQKELSEEEFLGKEARTQPPLSPSPPSTHAHASTQTEPSIFEDTRSESPQFYENVNAAHANMIITATFAYIQYHPLHALAAGPAPPL